MGDIMDDNFNLYRRNGKLVYIKQPRFDELSFVKELWSDKKNMGDTVEVYSFPREKWDAFYKKMVSPTDGKNFYSLIYDFNDNPIGEVSFHGYNSATKVARINIRVHYEYRRRGYAEEALRLLLEYYFFEFGGQAVIESINNNEGKALLKKIGFEELNRFRDQGTYKITKNKFISYRVNSSISVAILLYNDIDPMEYYLPFNIFSKANEIIGENYFDIYSLVNDDKITTKHSLIQANNIFNINMYPDIIVIPGGNSTEEIMENKELIIYLNKAYSKCDFIVVFSNGIYLMSDFIRFNGISIPNSKHIIDGVKTVNKDFVDNGKIMISNNLFGHIEICINVIKKIVGFEIAEKICKELGYVVK